LSFQYEFNDFIFLLKIVVILISIVCIIFAISYSLNEKMIRWEYYILVLFSSLGNLLLISSFDLMSIYFGIEIQSLSFYILASFKIHSNFSTEAGVKYFTQGAVASGIYLLGSSIIYFATGTTNIYSIYLMLNTLTDLNFTIIDFSNLFIFGLSLIIISLLMKLAVAPFHM
jgi:NADH:ubiquinone oxidoreductase subunit 2 (subunit N)